MNVKTTTPSLEQRIALHQAELEALEREMIAARISIVSEHTCAACTVPSTRARSASKRYCELAQEYNRKISSFGWLIE